MLDFPEPLRPVMELKDSSLGRLRFSYSNQIGTLSRNARRSPYLIDVPSRDDSADGVGFEALEVILSASVLRGRHDERKHYIHQ